MSYSCFTARQRSSVSTRSSPWLSDSSLIRLDSIAGFTWRPPSANTCIMVLMYQEGSGAKLGVRRRRRAYRSAMSQILSMSCSRWKRS